MLVLTVSVDPKLGNSEGVLAGYIFKIDPEPTSSMVFTTFRKSDSDSAVGGVFGQVVSSNYAIGADDFFDPVPDLIGLTGCDSAGLAFPRALKAI